MGWKASAQASAVNGVAIGSGATAIQNNGIAIGSNAVNNRTNSSDAGEVNAISIGTNSSGYAYSIAMGYNASADGGQGDVLGAPLQLVQTLLLTIGLVGLH